MAGRIIPLILVCLLIVSTARAGEPKYYWKTATLAPNKIGWSRLMKEVIFPEVEKATNGELKVKVYWGGIMGDESDYIEKMRDGTGLLDGCEQPIVGHRLPGGPDTLGGCEPHVLHSGLIPYVDVTRTVGPQKLHDRRHCVGPGHGRMGLGGVAGELDEDRIAPAQVPDR